MSVRANSTYNFIGQLLPIPLALVTIPLYLQTVGAERYGVLAIAWVLLGYFGIFDLGLSRATTYRIAALKGSTAAKRARVLWSSMIANLALGMLGAAILYGAASFYFVDIFEIDEALRSELHSAAGILALSVPVTMLTNTFLAGLQAREKFFELNVISTLSTALFQLLPLAVAWWLGPSLPAVLLAAVGARAIGMLALWQRCHRHILFGKRLILQLGELQKLLGFGGWITISAVVGPLMVVADRFVIGAISGAQAVTVYSIPFQLAQRTGILPDAIANALFPRLSATPDSPLTDELAEKATAATVALLSPLIFAAIILVDPFFRLWLGDALPPLSTPIAQILLLGFWVNGLAKTPFTIIQARGRPKQTALTHLAELLPYWVTLYVLGSSFGVIGVAAAFSLRCMADYGILSRLAFGDFVMDWRRVLLGALLLFTTITVNMRLGDQWASGTLLVLAFSVALLSIASLPRSVSEQLIGFARGRGFR